MDALPSCQMPICLMAPIAHVMTIGQVDSLAWALCPNAQLANCSIAPTPHNFGQLCIDALPSCPNAQSVNHSRLRSPTHSQTFTLFHIRKCSPFLSRSDAFILTHSRSLALIGAPGFRHVKTDLLTHYFCRAENANHLKAGGGRGARQSLF